MTPTALTSTSGWHPSRQLLEPSRLKQYIDWLFVKKGLYFRNYDDLWDWSVTDTEHFWESISQFFEVQFATPYQYVLQPSDDGDLIGTRWFGGATLSYAEHIFRQQTTSRPALLFAAEQQPLREVAWADLRHQVAAVSAFLRSRGVGVGDYVVAVLPNSPEAVIAFLAVNAIGAVWSVCSPDVNTESLTDRFQPLEPKVLIAVDGYMNNGRPIDRTAAMNALEQTLPTLLTTIWLPHLTPATARAEARPVGGFGTGQPAGPRAFTTYPANTVLWDDVRQTSAFDGLVFEPVPFAHPIWVLYSSGTAGEPKAITHSTGGCLLEHLKVVALHQDVRSGERYFWHANTGSMMWNVALSSMLVGATLVLYDGAPAYPSLTRLWELIDHIQVNHFGSGAAYFLTCIRSGMKPGDACRLTALRTICVTDAPLSAEGFRWVYEALPAVWLISFMSATDVCSGLAGGNPLLPVYAGEMQCRLLGCKVDAFDEQCQPVRNRPGELVILKPMPSMPVSIRNDSVTDRSRNSCFSQRTDVWWHNDWIEITDRHTMISYGRADATLNPDGRRIGTAEIYQVMEPIAAVTDSLIVGIERPGGPYFMPLFVVLRHGAKLTDDLMDDIKQALQNRYSGRYVPDEIIQVAQLPYTISGRKLEIPVRKLLSGTDVSLVMNPNNLRVPAALAAFAQLVDQITARW